MVELQDLLPAARELRVEHVRISPALIEIDIRGRRVACPCPACGLGSRRVHSRYVRLIHDLPWHGTPVVLRWTVRRFFCDEPTCSRKVFAEQLPELAARRARSTPARDHALVTIGLEAGGEAGRALAGELGLRTSGDTILRRLRATGARSVPPEEITEIGIDDFAIRRGQRYGTIIVDHRSHRVVDLLPDRSSQVTAAWLGKHPSIRLVTRDRSGAYATAVSMALPQAVQVSDRWHLCANLREALVRLLDRCHRDVTATARAVADEASQAANVRDPIVSHDSPDALADGHVPDVVDVSPVGASALDRSVTAVDSAATADPKVTPARPVSKAQALSLARRDRRVARYEQVLTLHASGYSNRAIKRQLHMSLQTVQRFLRAGVFPEMSKHRCHSTLDPLTGVLRSLWDAGTHNARDLFKRLRAQHNYRGGYDMVRRRVEPWRDRSHPTPGPRPVHPRPRVARVRPPRIASSRLAWLLSREEDRSVVANHPGAELEARLVDRLRVDHVEIAQAADLVRAFNPIMRERSVGKLAAWTEQALRENVADDIRAFAEGLVRDWPCVSAAMHHPHSNGRAEGHVNRLKLIKRKMYGRAKLDLLKIRMTLGR